MLTPASAKGGLTMSITATELKLNLGKYLRLAESEDVFITRNGKVIAKLSNPYQDRVDVVKSLYELVGVIRDFEHPLRLHFADYF